jgi:hypothetical protein
MPKAEKLSFEDLKDLAECCLNHATLSQSSATIKQFCEELQKDMQYHREIDLE